LTLIKFEDTALRILMRGLESSMTIIKFVYYLIIYF
jgi:hypothetical protein